MPKSEKPKKAMTAEKKAKLVKQADSVSAPPTGAQLAVAFRKQFSQFENIAQTVPGGLSILAQEVLARTAWLWSQGDGMTRERFLQASGEVYDASVKALEESRK